jgi:hypothetical protein
MNNGVESLLLTIDDKTIKDKDSTPLFLLIEGSAQPALPRL